MVSNPITTSHIEGENVEAVTKFLFLDSITADIDCGHEIRRKLLFGRKTVTNPDSVLKSRDYSANKGTYNQSYDLTRDHVWLWELDPKEGRMLKNRCLWTVVLENTSERLLDNKINLKGNQPCILEAEAPAFSLSDENSQLIGKVPDTGKDWVQKEKRASEDEMAGQHHRCNGHELGQIWEMVRDREAWGAAVYGVAKSWT